jgi:uncharacterized protein (TIGR03083 family)
MSAEAGIDQGLRLVRAESEALLAELRALSPAEWRHPSNCPPWDVALLVAHVSSGGEFFCSNIERGLAGVHTPAQSREERAAAAGRLAGAGPERIMATLVANTDQFEALVDRLDAAQLDTLAFHNHGLRPVRWFVFHRLAELIFHRWDVQASLGRATVPDDGAVGYLLPTMLEVNLPVLYTRGARGCGRLRVVTREQPPRAWLIEADGEALTARPAADGDAPALRLGAGDLGLLFYGREPLATLLASGRATADAAAVALVPSLLGNP